FTELANSSSMPLSQSRAAYWLGRSMEAAGNAREAENAFRRAASYPTTFYGQLAINRLRGGTLALSAPPRADQAARQRYAANPLVRAIDRLVSLDRGSDAALFARYLADTLTDPTEIALLAAGAEKRGDHQLALQI